PARRYVTCPARPRGNPRPGSPYSSASSPARGQHSVSSRPPTRPRYSPAVPPGAGRTAKGNPQKLLCRFARPPGLEWATEQDDSPRVRKIGHDESERPLRARQRAPLDRVIQLLREDLDLEADRLMNDALVQTTAPPVAQLNPEPGRPLREQLGLTRRRDHVARFPLHQSHTIALIRKDKPNRATERLHRLSTRGHPPHRQSRRGHGLSHPPTLLASPHGLHSRASRAPRIRP